MEYEGGATASFTMAAFNTNSSRWLKIMGTKGQINADMTTNEIWLNRFGEDAVCVPVQTSAADQFGHGGGDYGIVNSFVRLVNGEGDNLTSAQASLQSHLMCFAAEQSRLEHRAIDMRHL